MEKRVRASVVCHRNGRILAIELEDPTTKKRFWSVPGGEIEADESPAEAAARETLEETGYAVSIDEGSLLTTSYVFRWNASIYQCETHWFRGHLKEDTPSAVDDEEYLLGALWLPPRRLDELLYYHPGIRRAVRRLAVT